MPLWDALDDSAPVLAHVSNGHHHVAWWHGANIVLHQDVNDTTMVMMTTTTVVVVDVMVNITAVATFVIIRGVIVFV